MIKVQELKVKAETSNLEDFYFTMYKCSERLLKRVQLARQVMEEGSDGAGNGSDST